MKDIFLIRHGRQCSKLCNVDVSLDESGRKQAKLAGKRLISYQLEKLYCSHDWGASHGTAISEGQIFKHRQSRRKGADRHSQGGEDALRRAAGRYASDSGRRTDGYHRDKARGHRGRGDENF